MKDISTIILLGLIAVVGVFTLDVYLPGIPAMAKEFDVSINEISLTFTTFSIVFAISQLFHGVLSDYVGRKPILLVGLTIAGIATLFCINAKTYEILFGARLVQALGISVFVVVNAIIRDLYTGVKAIQIRTFVTTVSGISISIAPAIGGLLQHRFDWHGSFIASLVLIAITFIYAIIFFTESNQNQSQPKFTLNTFVKSYLQLFSDSRYVLHIVMAALAYTVHFTFIIMSAKIFIDLLGLSPLTFGYLMFVYGGIYFVSGFVATVISKKISFTTLLTLGGACIAASGVLMLSLIALFSLTAWQILFPMAMTTIGITIVRSTATTCALAPIPTQAGQGAAGLNLVQFTLAAVTATCISELQNQPQFSLALLAIVCSISIIFLTHFSYRNSVATKLISRTES